jgi:hypothetical protein
VAPHIQSGAAPLKFTSTGTLLTRTLMRGSWCTSSRGNLLQQWGQNKEQAGAEKRCARNREHPDPHNLTRDAPAHGG